MRRQAVDIGIEVARDLELEVAVPVGRDHLFQALRQAVVQALADVSARVSASTSPTVWRTWIDGAGRRPARNLAEIEAGEIGRGRGRQADTVLAHQGEHRGADEPPERIDDGALHQGEAERGDEPVEVFGRAGGVMRPLDSGGETEHGVGCRRR